VVWALLAILGVPIWLLLGALGATFFSRRRFKRQDGVFPLLFRKEGGDSWPRTRAYGRYLHDVLIVNYGLALNRMSVHAVAHVDYFELEDPPDKISDPVGLRLTLDDSTRVEILVASGSPVGHAPRRRVPDSPWMSTPAVIAEPSIAMASRRARRRPGTPP